MDLATIGSREFVEVEAEERLGKVRSVFEEENPKGVVVTEAGQYRGVITQKQLMRSHIEGTTRARALLDDDKSPRAPKIDREEDIRAVARMLVEADSKLAPVFEGDTLWGVVTVDDILEYTLDSLDALSVEDIYSEDAVTIEEDTTVGRIVNLMREHGVSRLPVLNENGHISGIVTTQDVVDVVIRDMNQTTVGDRSGEADRILDLPAYDEMSTPVHTVDAETTVEDAVRSMFDHGVSGLVVTGEEDRAVAGVLTKTDVLRALSYAEEEHLDVQITNIDLLDTVSRQEIRERIEEVAAKYGDMHVHHAHVRFHKHKERLRGTPLIRAQIRLRTNRGQVAGSGEGYGAENGFYVALDTLERNVLELKGIRADEEYRGQLLRKLGEI
jgi:predicted transcriptional regulator/ribosome-associated translation inhibitor RaiA